MPKIRNSRSIELKRHESPVPEYVWESSSNLAADDGLKRLASNIRVLPPGKVSYPYHFHHGAEEIFVILSGEGLLRTPGETRRVVQGDVIHFQTGPSGAHQLKNTGEENLTFLDIRTATVPDVCEYPDSGKINILPNQDIFYRGSSAGYFDGEEVCRFPEK